MKYRRMGKSEIDVSVIGHGTWSFGNDYFGEIDVEKGIKAIHQSLDLGVNLIDTAPGYGSHYEAELAVGKALKGRRDQAVISTKCGIHRIMGEYVRCLSPDVVRQELENSLTRLGTDYIDFYTIHWPDYNFGIDDALDLLAEFKKEGKIREGAVSNFTIEQIGLAVEKAGIVSVQPPCSLFDRSSFDNGIIPYCKEHNIGVMTYGSLGGGILTGKMTKPVVSSEKEHRGGFYDFYNEPMWTKCNQVIDVLREIAAQRDTSVAAVSINWVLAQPGVTCALMGSTSPINAATNAKAADWELSADELATINAAYDKFMG